MKQTLILLLISYFALKRIKENENNKEIASYLFDYHLSFWEENLFQLF